jgi:hypothetical protein
MTNTEKTLFNCQVAAILLMAAGFGWINGNFVQPFFTSWGMFADLLHLAPFVALLLLSLSLFSAFAEGKRARGARNGITIVAAIGILACLVFIILGASNPDPNSVGVHTFEDTMPVIVLNAGTLLWLSTLLPFWRRKQAASMAFQSETELAK